MDSTGEKNPVLVLLMFPIERFCDIGFSSLDR